MYAPRQVYIAVIGTGGVGSHVLSQLAALSQRFSQCVGTPIYLSLILLCRSNKILYHKGYGPLSLQSWEADLKTSTLPMMSMVGIAQFLSAAPASVVMIDNTSNQEVAESYPLFLKHGMSVVTPNKKAFSGDISLYEDIFNAAASSGAGLMYHESSVGAALPVISTLKDLVDTGDEVRKIEGIFSGTMSFLFNSFMPTSGGGGKFSEEVKKARDLGYTEPDPRDDLNGLDVARKLTILARLCGVPVPSPTDFPVQSLIPEPLESVSSGGEFMEKLADYDADFEKVKKEAEAEGKVIRYTGSIDVAKKKIKVGLEKFDKSHAIASLKGSDNIISFHTRRYSEHPLTIQGAGAGQEVTAMGVTADLIKVLQRLHFSVVAREEELSSLIRMIEMSRTGPDNLVVMVDAARFIGPVGRDEERE
ncbi:MAG: hypothetical protein M1827_002742 [Pycnora praestabilis]|nr:MAG: hypothetical protein M1827_002742 [Pycnora praestabilis]